MKFTEFLKLVIIGVVPLVAACYAVVAVIALFVSSMLLSRLLIFLAAILLSFAEVKWIEFAGDKGWFD